MHYVYILQSQIDGSFYKGYSINPLLRLEFHNLGKSNYTKNKLPWTLVALLHFDDKSEALSKEKKLKKYGHNSLIALINSTQNILVDYLKNLENL